MKKIILSLLVICSALFANAQITKATLQASGLTCSMCSKAVKTALDKVSFVEKVQVDIKNQQYNITFRENADVDPDALSKAVEDAGFSVASLKVTANVPAGTVEKDKHIKIGKAYYHFLNDAKQDLDGSATFNLVDRNFVSAKEFKKYSAASHMQCVKTGRSASCCPDSGKKDGDRIYHAII